LWDEKSPRKILRGQKNVTALRVISPTEPPAADSLAAEPLTDAERRQLQSEIETLREEVNHLRRRDETLQFYMHRLDEELRLAARLQQDFLPKSLPKVGPIVFHTLFRPAGYVSGDLYDVMRLDETHVGFYMADAVGHGMPAALLTMFIKNALVTKQIIPGGYRLLNPGESLKRVNDALVEQNLSQATFATAVYGTIDTRTLQCKYARAGHPPPLLLRKEGSMESLSAEGGLVGIFPDAIYDDGHVQLAPGDRLFIYSDGIEVAFALDQALDTRQWKQELENRRHLPTEQIVTELSEALDKETGSLQPRDDLSLIVVEVK
jgi:sigma-B regulation protein RsbU (phosphoserine phosphatase)